MQLVEIRNPGIPRDFDSQQQVRMKWYIMKTLIIFMIIIYQVSAVRMNNNASHMIKQTATVMKYTQYFNDVRKKRKQRTIHQQNKR